MTVLDHHAPPRVEQHSRLSPGARFCAVMVVVALMVPANLVVAGPLRSLGSASRLFGLLALGLVLVVFVRREMARAMWAERPRSTMVVPSALLLYVITILALYGVSYQRLMGAEEIDGGTRALFGAFAVVGAGLAAALLVDDLRGLRTVMGCIVAGLGFSAFVGIVQSRFSLDLAAMLRLPGLAINREVSTELRNTLTRVVGSSGHPIEFTVILASAVPLALYVATYASSKGRRQLAAFAAVLMLASIPLGVSRSGIVGVAVALLFYGVVWSWRQRVTAAVLAVGGLVFYRLVQPGVLGTIYGLFSNASDDPSVAARTDDYPRVAQLLTGRELFGLGPGTFQPDVYFTLDNQYLLSYADGGIVGVAAFCMIPLVGFLVAWAARARGVDPAVRDAAQAILAAITATAACAATFDMLAFQQVSTLLFIYVGLASAALVVASATRANGSVDVQNMPAPGVGGTP